MRVIGLLILVFCGAGPLLAQSPPDTLIGRPVCRWLSLNPPEQPLDSLSVLPSTISLSDSSLSFTYELSTGLITFRGTSLPDSVEVCYRRLAFNLAAGVQHHSLQEYDSTAPFRSRSVQAQEVLATNESFFQTPEISKSGSLSRGVSLGNNQDVVVQSSLNLELDGRLSDKIGIRASVTDQDVPFQPEGNTQNLQEFDRVYVELFTDSSRLMGGDLMLRLQPNPFLKFQRSVQGLAFSHRFKYGELEVAAASAKGQYIVAELNPTEGLLGPYRLPGTSSQGEQFSAVLANSEKVYLDGKLLIRGFNQDYIIDYNLGEITFSPGTLITQYSQIRVEYEYTDQAYRRGLTVATYQHQQGRVKLQASLFQEQDNRQRPLFTQLSSEDRQLLSQAGDELGQVFSSTVDSLGYRPETILYARRDSLVNGISYEYYQYSTNPEEAYFQLSFARVEGGNYVLSGTTAQGRIFSWVAPLNGRPQGEYEPVRLLEAPKRQRSLGLSSQVAVGSYGELFIDGAFSDRDLNLFSPLDEADDRGGAFRLGYQLKDKPLPGRDSLKLRAGVSLEQLTENYTAIDPFRPANYDRYWGLVLARGATQQYLSYGRQDRVLSTWLGLYRNALNNVNYQLSQRNLSDSLQGWQHQLSANKQWGKLQSGLQGFITHSQLPDQRVVWRQLRSQHQLNLAGFRPGYALIADQNYFRDLATDSVSFSAQYYTEHQLFVENPEEANAQYRLQYSLRTDRLPQEGEMQRASRSHQYSARWLSDPEKHQQFSLSAAYRYSQALLDTARAADENILTGQFSWLGQFAEGLVRQEFRYALGSGREYRRDYVYLPVPAGQGTHFWRDDNGDGQQQLDEFYEATFADERQYIRLLTVGSELAQAYSSELNYRLSLAAPRSWQQAGGGRQWLSRFSLTGSLRVEQKVNGEGLAARYLPLISPENPDNRLYQRQNWQASLFYNRANPRWGADLSVTHAQRQQFISAGQEVYESSYYLAGIRRNFSRLWNLRLEGLQSQQANRSAYLQDKQFAILGYGLKPQLTWLPRRALQIQLDSRYLYKHNELAGEQAAREAVIKEVGLGATYSRSLNTQLRLQFKLSQIEFEGQGNSPASYALLEALQPGQNLQWSAQWQQKLMQGLFLQAQYNARSSELARTIHTGNMSIRALF